jgi:protocatechuate 3,4-dioxygenase alpha subunit
VSRLPTTPSQTVGPFFSIGLSRPQNELVQPGSAGALRLFGQVIDGAGDPVPDAMLEVWNRDVGWGRSCADGDGGYSFWLRTPPGRGDQAPHLEVLVFARGLLRHLVTRVYFPGETANAADPVLAGLPGEAQASLIAVHEDGGLRWDVRLQGEGETTFFEP